MAEEECKEEKKLKDEPEVYTVKKDINGWQFNRRAFLAAAGATTAAAAVGTVAGCSPAPGGSVVTRVVIIKEVTNTPMPTPEATATPTPTPTPPPTLTPTATVTPTPTLTPTATVTPTPAVPQARFIKDVTIPDGTVMKPGQEFTKTWRFQNVGAVPWGKGVQLVFVEGKLKGFESKKMGGPDAVEVPDVAPGKTVDVSVNLTAPKELGHYRSYWRLRLGNGQWLENPHYVEIFVASDKSLQETVAAGKKGIEFKVKVEGKWVTWTQPCGMPIPPGAVCICNCVVVELPGDPGEVPPGQNGGTITGPGGETRWLPCGSPIPPGWTCTCNCVSVPAPCSCDGVCTCDRVCTCDGVCSCVGYCTCDTVHYWYPN